MTTLGYHYGKETRRKVSEALKGRIVTEETRKKIGERIKREKNGNWKGGLANSGGRIFFKAPEGCQFSCMKNGKGYILIHRLIMAEYLQRPLKDEEVVHHINEDITDNRIENLRLFENKGEHTSLHKKMKGDDEKLDIHS